MKDPAILARCNLYAVLGAIPHLLYLDPEAAALVRGKNIRVGFSVKNGPKATLVMEDGSATMVKGVDQCSIKLWFPSVEKFNDLIDGKGTPIPVSGFLHIGFLLKTFTRLTDILSAYLRPDPAALANPVFFERSTTLMLYVIGRAIVQIGNHDKVGMFSASNITDGKIKLGIGDNLSVAIHAKDSHLMFNPFPNDCGVTSQMVFTDLKTARDLFDGNVNAIVAVGMGQVRIGGMVSQVDNINRILDRVAIYLA
ncbi:MAG: hypothetical protein IJ363_00565 [Clostridia bacterium]|nr:hypothetical protein [Clostridia bacterium]